MGQNAKLFLVAGLLIALGVGIFVSPFASGSPDGLEKVSIDEGFDETARDHDLADSPLADYGVSGIDNEKVSTGVAGLVGTLVTFGLGLGLFASVRAMRPEPRPTATGLPASARRSPG